MTIASIAMLVVGLLLAAMGVFPIVFRHRFAQARMRGRAGDLSMLARGDPENQYRLHVIGAIAAGASVSGIGTSLAIAVLIKWFG